MENIYLTIDTIIKAQKKARQDHNYLLLMENAEAMLEYLPQLINDSVDQESAYRKFEAELVEKKDENGKRFTSAYCETKAKATDWYKGWQKSKMFIELMYEMVQIAKKLASSVDKEFNVN